MLVGEKKEHAAASTTARAGAEPPGRSACPITPTPQPNPTGRTERTNLVTTAGVADPFEGMLLPPAGASDMKLWLGWHEGEHDECSEMGGSAVDGGTGPDGRCSGAGVSGPRHPSRRDLSAVARPERGVLPQSRGDGLLRS